MNSLLDSVKDYLTPDVIRKIGSAAGETPENTKRAMDNIVPTLLFGAAKVADSPGGDNQLMSLINKQTSDGNILSNLAGQLSGESAAQGLMNSGRDAAKALFGGKLNSVIDTLARSLGLKSSSIASLLSIAAPIVLGVLGKERSARGLGASGLASLLSGERNILSQILPAGLGSVLGWGDGGRTEERIADTVGYDPARTAYGTVAREKGTDWWLWPALGLAALGFLLTLSGCARPLCRKKPLPSRKSDRKRRRVKRERPLWRCLRPCKESPHRFRKNRAWQDQMRQFRKARARAGSMSGESKSL